VKTASDVVRDEVETVPDGPEYDLELGAHPERYRHTPDERGAYKNRVLQGRQPPVWTVSDFAGAEAAAEAIHERFEAYRAADYFVGMDLARRDLQMGWTRALRYAKYLGRRKYERDADGDRVEREPDQWYDEEKHAVAQVYREYLDCVREDTTHRRLRDDHRERYGE
jgi:hypothetical protein